ncbi:MAG: cellulose biosynthesis cyclic di-GMP-binding regulatory protein BcsB [Nitrospinota bacterium]|nr:cellulose biosynthesis cyclic di-GMP-binding regulatory protein BcsB [Nitrospinota bacterium]
MLTQNKKWIFLARAVFLAVALLIPGTAQGETLEIPLNKLTPYPIIDLRCVNGTHEISIPIPERWSVKSAVLKITYAASPVLVKEESRLTARINDFPVGYIPLDPSKHKMVADLIIPPEMMKPGYNTLALEVFQHYSTKECEFPCSPDLWTKIMLEESFLVVVYDQKPFPLTLSSFSKVMFDPKTMPHGRVNIITEGASNEIIGAAVIAASGIAKRFDYREVHFSVSQDILPGVDNALIGRAEFVLEFLKQRGVEMEPPTAGVLRMEKLPVEKVDANGDKYYEKSPSHALVIITGRDYNDVKIASETLANMTVSFPGSTQMTTIGFSMPEIELYSGRLVLTADRKYDFKTLNLGTHTFTGFNSSPRGITFRLPADFLIKSNKKAILSLNFTYGPGFGPTSSFNLLVNDKVIRAIHLDARSGAFIEDYKVDIPAYMFRVGTNTISFEPHMAPEAKLCDFIQTGNLILTLFDSSSLYFPPMPHFVELPKIELFLLNGFPFTRWPDGYDSMLYLADDDNLTVEAALNVIGFMTQRNGFPLFGMEVTTQPPLDWKGELLVVGQASKISQKILKNAPLSFGEVFKVPYPVVTSWEGDATLAFSENKAEFGANRGLFMEFQSPFRDGRTVFLMTAAGREELVRTSKALLDGGVQAKMEGDISLVELNEPNYSVTSYSAGKKYTTGKSGKISRVESFLMSDPWMYYGAIILLILAVGTLAYFFMKSFLKGRAKNA